jgi:formate-dependent nitrite reductase cytochrome c552 subunit
LLLGACAAPLGAAETPGLELGSPGIAWAAKNDEQRFGFMASQVHPRMQKLFREYKPESYEEFSCTNCHGASMEQIDYAMPNQSLYALPKAKPYDDAIDFDTPIAVFMMTKVTPTLQELFNKGEGPRTKVTCFNCHPGN